MAENLSRKWKLGFTAVAGSLPATKRVAFETCNFKQVDTLVEPEAEMTGQLPRRSESLVDGTKTTSGAINITPRLDDLQDVFLPAIFGGLPDPAAIGTFAVSIDREVKVYNTAAAAIASATFTSSAGQLLKLAMQVEGLATVVANAGTFPSLDLSTMRPLIHHLGVLTIGGTAYRMDNVSLNVNNNLILDDFWNSQTRVELPQGERLTQLEVDLPFTTTEFAAMYAAVQVTGATGSLVYTDGAGNSLGFAFPSLHWVPPTPDSAAKQGKNAGRFVFLARTLAGDPIPGDVQIDVTIV